MSEQVGPSGSIPIVADGAPQLSFGLNIRSHEETKAPCRRVVTLLGARDGCKLTLRHDLVSPVHLAVVNDGYHVFAIDLASRRGTRLNGLKLQHERLSDGDVLTVHPWELRVEIGQPTPAGDSDVLPFALEPSPRHVVLEHVDSGRLLKPTRELCVIGRRNGCDIVVSDRRVSRVHAMLLSYFGRPAIVDLLSRNGTVVNDEPVTFRYLEEGDAVTIGETRFRVRLIGSTMGDRSVADSVAAEGTVVLDEEQQESDLIDIHTTENAQNWRIADTADTTANVAKRR